MAKMQKIIHLKYFENSLINAINAQTSQSKDDDYSMGTFNLKNMLDLN